MKDIKFRCWNAHGKVMHTWSELAEKNKIHLLASQKPSYAIMQYTGMKDKNGVELYEGDIYRNWGEVYLCEFDTTMYRKLECTLMDGDFEIIGNIYENPELFNNDNT